MITLPLNLLDGGEFCFDGPGRAFYNSATGGRRSSMNFKMCLSAKIHAEERQAMKKRLKLKKVVLRELKSETLEHLAGGLLPPQTLLTCAGRCGGGGGTVGATCINCGPPNTAYGCLTEVGCDSVGCPAPSAACPATPACTADCSPTIGAC